MKALLVIEGDACNGRTAAIRVTAICYTQQRALVMRMSVTSRYFCIMKKKVQSAVSNNHKGMRNVNKN